MLSPELPSPSKRTKITHHFPIQNSENSMEERVARMTAKDGLPLSVFVTSEDLRELFKAKGFLLPRSSTTIRMMVMNYGMTLRMKVVNELSQLKETGPFSLTFDEWTSSSNRREFRKYPEAGETCCRSTLSRDPANTGIPRDLNSNSRQYRDRAWGAGLEALVLNPTLIYRSESCA
ncbi:hypothetical protein EVAR_91707_1 [Eumeta japonica]|uniref:Uncharacterized protein n=1 Tax=Eumeta variegata TaxID=151549 RepID=A0A4C1SXW4_EUMVA|nr:hypothetical protein EVAR_91707_1 [Eumeta japonica]